MKLTFLLTLTLIATLAKAQVNVSPPTIHYVSAWKLEELNKLPVGLKILFSQNCDPASPAQIPNGVVLFENVKHNDEKLSIAIEFKDTIVDCVTYYMDAKQKNILKTIGLAEVKALSAVKKGEWTYSGVVGETFVSIVGDKKKITVIKRRIPARTT